MTGKRVTMNSLRENLLRFRDEINAVLLGERERSVWERMNDWCEDQLTVWADHLDRHYGLWIVALLVFLVLGLSVGLVVRLT